MIDIRTETERKRDERNAHIRERAKLLKEQFPGIKNSRLARVMAESEPYSFTTIYTVIRNA